MGPEQFVLLLEGKADYLKNCGIRLVMPSADTMAQADPQLLDRFRAIQNVDLGPDAVPNGLAGKEIISA